MKIGYQLTLVVSVILALIGGALLMASATMDAPLTQETRMWYNVIGLPLTLFSGIVIGVCFASTEPERVAREIILDAERAEGRASYCMRYEFKKRFGKVLGTHKENGR